MKTKEEIEKKINELEIEQLKLMGQLDFIKEIEEEAIKKEIEKNKEKK